MFICVVWVAGRRNGLVKRSALVRVRDISLHRSGVGGCIFVSAFFVRFACSVDAKRCLQLRKLCTKKCPRRYNSVVQGHSMGLIRRQKKYQFRMPVNLVALARVLVAPPKTCAAWERERKALLYSLVEGDRAPNIRGGTGKTIMSTHVVVLYVCATGGRVGT